MSQDVLLFPPFRLDATNQQLWRESRLVPLRPKAFAVLLYLAQHCERLVPKEELLKNVWAGVSVSAELLRVYVRELRQVLGDDAKTPRYIETVPRRGYRFLKHTVSPSFPDSPADEEKQAAPSMQGGSKAPQDPGMKHIGPTPRVKLPLRVGILHSLTGMMAWSERPVIDATLLAVQEINERGGILGHRVEPVVVDGESDERAFSREAERLITEERVCTTFGCWMSATRKAVLPIIEHHDHLLIYPTQYEGMEQCPNIFYIGGAPNQQVIPAIRWAFAFLRKRRFFLIGWNSVYSWAINAIIRDEIRGLGGEIIGEDYLLPTDTDVAAVVCKIIRSEPDMILNSLVGDMSLLYSRALRAAGVMPERVPTIYLLLSEIELLGLGPRGAFGDYAARNYFQSLDRPENRAFISRFRSRYGLQRVIADPMEAGYVGVHLWAQAVEAAGGEDIPAIRRALRNQRFEAPEGTVQIDRENQHAWKTIRLGKVIEGGQFEVTWSFEKPIRPEPFPSSRTPAAWKAFLENLFKRWRGHWTKPHVE